MSHRIPRWSRRRPLRHAVRLACQVVRERDFKLVSRLILDLSERGALVASPAVVFTGEPLIVSFRAPLSDDWVDVEATVARVVHGRRDEDFSLAVGIEFGKIDAASYALLKQQLAGFPLPPPGRDVAGNVWVPDKRLLS